jgi:hypothetical protein
VTDSAKMLAFEHKIPRRKVGGNCRFYSDANLLNDEWTYLSLRSTVAIANWNSD